MALTFSSDGKLKKVLDRLALRGARRLRDLVDLRLKHAAAVGKEKNVVVRVRAKEMREEIFVGDLGADQAFAAALLGLECARREPLDVSAAARPSRSPLLPG